MTQLIVSKYSINADKCAPYGYTASIDSIASPSDPTKPSYEYIKYQKINLGELNFQVLLLISGALQFKSSISIEEDILSEVSSSIKKNDPKNHKNIVEEVCKALCNLSINGNTVIIFVLSTCATSEVAQSSSITYSKNDVTQPCKIEYDKNSLYKVALGEYFPKQDHFTNTFNGNFDNVNWNKSKKPDLETLKKYSKIPQCRPWSEVMDKKHTFETHQVCQNMTVDLSELADSQNLRPFAMGPIHFFDVSPEGITEISNSN